MKILLIPILLILFFVLLLTLVFLAIFLYLEDWANGITAQCRENGCKVVLNGAVGAVKHIDQDTKEWLTIYFNQCEELGMKCS